MKIVTVVGARPQFIKMAPVSLALRAQGQREIPVHTGQHYDPEMSDVFFQELGLPEPEVNLEAGSGSHGAQTARILEGMEAILQKTAPQRVIVIGDTNSTLAGALAAAKLGLPVAHVEAGLRSRNRAMPEEHNRICADHLSDRLYYATRAARANLQREGLLERAVEVGDVSHDAVRLFSRLAPDEETVRILAEMPRPFTLLTLHRAENTDDPRRLAALWHVLQGCAWPVLFPVHPRTRRAAERAGLSFGGSLRPFPPVGYPGMLHLLRESGLLLTDSGGLQKEAYFLQRPCLTLRTETEWVETVTAGWNRLYDVVRFPPIDVEQEAARRGGRIDEYGDGHAAEAIAADVGRPWSVEGPGRVIDSPLPPT